ncbi:CBP80/20-dependent translation initiation factor isoform X2 [Electrophorus electricus]|uniref:CBP80/20-dependent translation initiation factor isoform X2 n=1 Tax=Electrophorus electricus TaxID=8005 RepID=UPI0015D06231|nr:CBP80/20-dependent translation initiation factor isoform X2 [Electrophorus electricus]
MESSSVASASSEAGSTRSQEIEELERFIDSYVLEYQVQGLLGEKNDIDPSADKTQSHISQDEWEHSSNGSTGSRPSSGSRSGSQGHNNLFCAPSKNGNRDGSFDILGTDIWAANTMDSHGGATWDLQPEKLDFSQFPRKQFRGTPKPLPHIDREGMMKSKFEDDGVDLNDMGRFLPNLPIFPPLPNEAEIATTKKLFRRRRSDRRPAGPPQDQLTVLLPAQGRRQVSRRQQRPPGGGGGGGKPHTPPHHHQQQPHSQQQQQPQMTNQTQQFSADHQSDGTNAKYGGRGHHGGQPSRGPPHHCYSQNRRWYQLQKQQTNSVCQAPGPGDRGPPRTSKEAEGGRSGEQEPATDRPKEAARGDDARKVGKEGGRVNLLQSSKERLRRRLKEKEEVPMVMMGPQRNRMEKLLELLNSMRSNSSGAEDQLSSFMEEAQNSADSEETLGEIVQTIYRKAVSDRGFAATAAKLCDKMALFMVEGTKFRSLLLNMLQRDFTRRAELQRTDVECWLGFITFLCEVFGTMRSSMGEPFRVLVGPIYTCLRELLESVEVKEDAVLCCSMELQSAGRLLEEQFPEMMSELLAVVRDKMLCPSESPLTRSLLMEVVELHAHRWGPLEALTTQYYNRTIQKLTA